MEGYFQRQSRSRGVNFLHLCLQLTEMNILESQVGIVGFDAYNPEIIGEENGVVEALRPGGVSLTWHDADICQRQVSIRLNTYLLTGFYLRARTGGARPA